ncbi:MAG: glycosyltransferase family 9 protein [Fibrobacter sp.]|nr:glycosyltransferase family 9 protein [Fibrobacter sp.]
MSALIYHNGALGDFLNILPSIDYWKKRDKIEEIVLLGKPRFGNLARSCGLINEIWDIESSRFVSLFCDICSEELRCALKRFKKIVLFTHADSPLVKHAVNAGPDYFYRQDPFPDKPVHISDHHISLFSSGIFSEHNFQLKMPTEVLQKARSTLKSDNSIAICPGSGSRVKNWPFENFKICASELRNSGYSILWVSGPAEEDLCFPVEDIVLKNQDLSLLSALFSMCRGYIGNDSGITHLAAFSGCPVIALFGPSDPKIWSPRGEMVTVLYKPESCSPCHPQKHNHQTCSRLCMIKHEPQTVVSDLLRGQRLKGCTSGIPIPLIQKASNIGCTL